MKHCECKSCKKLILDAIEAISNFKSTALRINCNSEKVYLLVMYDKALVTLKGLITISNLACYAVHEQVAEIIHPFANRLGLKELSNALNTIIRLKVIS